MRKFRNLLAFVLAACLIMASCGEDSGEVLIPTEPPETGKTAQERGEVVILFTGGLEGEFARDTAQGALGYAALKAYADGLKEEDKQVILIDGGCALDVPGKDGLWDIVDACGYDLRIPGIVELASGVDALVDRSGDLRNGSYISCNLINLSDQTTVFEPYALVELDGIQIGVVGVTDPGALGSQESEKYGLLGSDDEQALYEAVQKAVDDAADAGASYVIVAGNLGTAVGDSPYTTVEVISGITGLVAWLDCGSGSVLDGDTVTDKDDFEIPLCAPGYGFRYVGQVVLNLNDGSADVKLITELTEEDRTVRALADDLKEE